jgi:hypothetical protein
LARPLARAFARKASSDFYRKIFEARKGSRKADILEKNSAGTPELKRLKKIITFSLVKSHNYFQKTRKYA